MATSKTPPPTPIPTTANTKNVASLATPSTISTLKSVDNPKAFGDQIPTAEAQKQISANTTSLFKLEKEKALLIKEGIQLDIDHQLTLFKFDIEHKKYQALNSGSKSNETPTPTPPQLTQSVITAGTPPYKDKESGFGDNQIEVKITDKNNTIILDYILDPPNTSFNDIQQSVNDVKSQLKELGDQAEILKNKRYLIHIYGVPEDQQPEPQRPKGLSDEEYQIALINENGGILPNGTIVEGNYPAAKKDLQERKDKNQKDIDDFKKDRKKKQKERKAKRKEKRAQRKNRTKEEKRKARKAKAKTILASAKGAAKSLVPVLILLLSNKIADVIAQNDKIQKLVNDTNAIITDANESGDPTKLANAQLARDNAIKIIQSNEKKINEINTQIQRITIYITIFSTIVSIISAIPIPTAPVPIVTSLIIKFIKILDKANRILLTLSAFLPIISSILDKAIDILEDLKAQLLNINGELESANNGSLTNNGNGFGTTGGKYKGFRFAIREDNSFGGKSINGFKRHYAVAIDINNVDVLKSELSFTLDPNDLIEQLKLVIDNQGLFTGPIPNENTIEEEPPININTTNALIVDAQQQQQQQQQQNNSNNTSTRPPLTPSRRSYWKSRSANPALPLSERDKARDILNRGYE